MISVREALAFILNYITVGPETVALAGMAPGLVLTESARAPNNISTFAGSTMDDYAVRSVDTVDATRKRPLMLDLLIRSLRDSSKETKFAFTDRHSFYRGKSDVFLPLRATHEQTKKRNHQL